jgi:hypothetical protein
MNIAIPDRYLLAADFEQRAIDFNFPAEVWNVAAELSEVSEATSPYELELLTGQSADQVREALERLLAKNLVRQNLIPWKEFAAARKRARDAAKNDAGEIPLGVTPKAAPIAAMPPAKQAVQTRATAAVKPVQPQVQAPLQATVRNGTMPAPEGVALRLGSIAPQKTTAGTTNAWVWQKPDPAQVAASQAVMPAAAPSGEQAGGRLLRPLLAQIENLKGGGVEGQLLVYQVFLRVPYQLLHDEGIKSLHFVDERTVIQNPTLHAAIVKAAKEVTGVDLV